LRVAAIDCGTNSIRLLVADVADGRLTEVSRRMEIVRLGEGVDRTGHLAPGAIERTRETLAGYTAELREAGAERVRMVATSASRDAANADDFRAMVLDTLGAEPEVITGDEEARLSFAGAVRGLDAPGPYLVVDIGGGSTEFVTGSGWSVAEGGDGGSEVEHAVSVDIGCVRMTERHLPDDPPGAVAVAAARADITAQVDRALTAVHANPGDGPEPTFVGLAGSVTTVAALALGLREYDPARIHQARIDRPAVERVTAELLTATRAERLASAVMHPGRADVIGAGALILQVIMERLDAPAVIASEHDILDGIAFSAASIQ